MKVGQRFRSVRAKTPLPKQIGATIFNKGWVNWDLKPTSRKYNIISKRQITVRSQTGTATDVTTEEITKHAKGYDDWETIITKEFKSHLKRLI